MTTEKLFMLDTFVLQLGVFVIGYLLGKIKKKYEFTHVVIMITSAILMSIALYEIFK